MSKPEQSEPSLDATALYASHDLAATSEITPTSRPESAKRPRRRLTLLSGSHPGLSEEIRDVLRYRIRIASLLLFAGFLTFLVYRLVAPRVVISDTPKLETITFWSHVCVTAITGFIGIRLCTNCRHLNDRIRLSEFLVFGGSAAFFVLVSLARLLASAQQGYIATINGPWLLLIFTYAFFVPNHWKRALIVIAFMASAPLGVSIAAVFYSDTFRELALQPEFRGTAFIELSLSMALAAAIATLGVNTIRSLRTEAFEAKQLGQYRLKQLLGSGGMGDVYVGEHMLLKRPCAIKVIRPEKAGDPQVLERFEREVQSTARLTHWNTVDIYDYGRTEDGTFYYVMEYLPGLNLQELVELHGALPEARVIHLICQTCDALSEAHAVGMVHRDLKPANIYAASRGHRFDVAKLLDFGLVRASESSVETSDPTEQDMALTQQNTIIGSPLFMAPEQARGGSVDARSDIYSLGIVVYFLLSGRTPFTGNSAIQVILAHAQQLPDDLSDVGISSEMGEIVMRCLAKDPVDRFQSVDELRVALEQCEAATDWNWNQAANWWADFGCPRKKAIDGRVVCEPLFAGHS